MEKAKTNSSLPEVNCQIIYEDKFCRITTEEIIINCYYFPTTQKKRIKLNKVATIGYESQDASSLFSTKGWGMSLSPVWWAKDVRRQCGSHYTNVAIDVHGENITKGFTVENINEFLSVLYPRLTPNTKIINKIP